MVSGSASPSADQQIHRQKHKHEHAKQRGEGVVLDQSRLDATQDIARLTRGPTDEVDDAVHGVFVDQMRDPG